MKKPGLFLAFLVVLLSCGKEIVSDPDCTLLISGIEMQDELAVKTEIEILTVDLIPVPQDDDPAGHRANLDELAKRLNAKCSDLTASVLCYACIETYPAISVLRIDYQLHGQLKSCVVDILTPDEDILRYAGLHAMVSGE